MHQMFILGGLLHATALAVVGFFVLFAASRSQGLLRTVGNVLGVWLFVLAVLAIVLGLVIGPRFGGGPMGFRMMMGGHRSPWMQPGQPAVSAPSVAQSVAPAAR